MTGVSTLRPQQLNDFIGQKRLKDNLQILVDSAIKRKDPLDHILFVGPPGLGKTSLSHILAKEMQVNIKVTSGPALDKTGDLAAILTNLDDKDILFIDEIHRLHKTIEELLYPAMEDFALDIVVGKGPSARTLRLDLPKFTIVGATTRVGLMSSPLRDRFGSILRVEFYTLIELKQIIKRSSQYYHLPINDQSAAILAKCSRGTPRIANKLFKRVRDFSIVHNQGCITTQTVHQSLDLQGIDKLGLDKLDEQIITTIIEKFDGGPVGLQTISASISEEADTIEDVYEPYLLQIGFLKRTRQGRVATRKAHQHYQLEHLYHLSNPNDQQSSQKKLI